MITFLGERLKKARKNAKMSGVVAAEKIGIAYPTLYNYENGKRVPDAELINKIAKVYNCDAGWLISGGEKPIVAETSPEWAPVSEAAQWIVEGFEQLPTKKRSKAFAEIQEIIRKILEENNEG